MRSQTSNCIDTAQNSHAAVSSFLCKSLCQCSLEVLSLLLESPSLRAVGSFDVVNPLCAVHVWQVHSDLIEPELCSHQA